MAHKNRLKFWNNKKKMKYALLLCSVFLIASVSAIWFLNYEARTGLTIFSSLDLTFSDNFNESTIADTSYNSYSKTETILISNEDGDINLNVSILENITDDVWDDCDNSNDVIIFAEYNSTIIYDGDQILIPNGDHELNLTIEAIKYACPQQIIVDLALTQI